MKIECNFKLFIGRGSNLRRKCHQEEERGPQLPEDGWQSRRRRFKSSIGCHDEGSGEEHGLGSEVVGQGHQLDGAAKDLGGDGQV